MLSLVGFKSKSFTLLWRGSRDGFESTKFHSLCDEKPNTLTVAETTTECIFGGYTSLPWTLNGSWKADNEAYIFTLKNPRNQQLKLNVKTGNLHAVYHGATYGPTFGYPHDLYVCNCSNKNTGSQTNGLTSYKNDQITTSPFYLGDSYNFQTVEVEVFQIA